MKALVGAFNQEKALVGAFSVIVQPVVEPMDHFTALLRTEQGAGKFLGPSLLPAQRQSQALRAAGRQGECDPGHAVRGKGPLLTRGRGEGAATSASSLRS